jgi:SHS2 domain-containing protein
MPYRWVEHTGELELELEARSERGVFEAGFAAMRELLADGDQSPQRLELGVDLSAADRAVLLADWLAELAYLAETQGLVPDRLTVLELEEDELRATVQGWEGVPPHLVKGATYHRLRFERAGQVWCARVVLDV